MKNKMTWPVWWSEIKKLYAQPVETYDGMVYLAGTIKGVKKVFTPTPEQVEKWADNRTEQIYKSYFKAGYTPEQAWGEMT